MQEVSSAAGCSCLSGSGGSDSGEGGRLRRMAECADRLRD